MVYIRAQPFILSYRSYTRSLHSLNLWQHYSMLLLQATYFDHQVMSFYFLYLCCHLFCNKLFLLQFLIRTHRSPYMLFICMVYIISCNRLFCFTFTDIHVTLQQPFVRLQLLVKKYRSPYLLVIFVFYSYMYDYAKY